MAPSQRQTTKAKEAKRANSERKGEEEVSLSQLKFNFGRWAVLRFIVKSSVRARACVCTVYEKEITRESAFVFVQGRHNRGREVEEDASYGGATAYSVRETYTDRKWAPTNRQL